MKNILKMAAVTLPLTMLVGCGPDKPTDAELAEYKAGLKANMVPIKGGTFRQGDQGRMLDNNGEVRHFFWGISTRQDLSFDVTLSNFSIYKYPVSFAEYDIYRKSNKLPLYKEKWLESEGYAGPLGFTVKRKVLRSANMPAIPESWGDAQSYCQWAGKQLNENWDLPTEAQFEYAARNRGENVRMATPDGSDNADLIFPYSSLPVGSMSPNKLGLYQMNANRAEWVKDWYGSPLANIGKHLVDPQGPKEGTKKVRRGGYYARMSINTFTTYFRESYLPDKSGYSDGGWRCVKNS